MTSCRNILLSGQTGPTLGTPAVSAFTLPDLRADAAIETVYRITVEAPSATPHRLFSRQNSRSPNSPATANSAVPQQ